MKRLIWMTRAYLYMRSRCGWARWGIVDSLYETYVLDDPSGEWQPAAAVDEELSYWSE